MQYQEAKVDSVLDRRYKLRREIARGGHGAVFEAEHHVTQARVAIKTLARPALGLPGAHARLFREARFLGALRHPNLIAVYDAGLCATHGPYLVLEMIEGRPLDGVLLTRRTLPVAQAVSLTLQLCDALGEAHRHGIIHRDIKPSNLLIARRSVGDRLELIDFGIAKLISEEDEAADKLTKAGELIGTAEYMAPEQLMASAPVDARSDVYAAGVVLYECLTGEVPYAGPPTAVITNMLAGARPFAQHPRRDEIPLALQDVVKKALEIDPAKRFTSAAELARACAAALPESVPVLDLLEAREQRSSGASHGASHPPGPSTPAPAATASHRRQYTRAPYITPVRVLVGQSISDGRTEDLSEGGVLMVTEGAVPDGERVTLRLPMPVSGRVVELQATTKWIKTGRNGRAIGAEFIDAPQDVRSEIRSYVALMTGANQPPPRVL
ncbi:MAG TPA: serine/threonine-protein kinase [Polyangiales bacterium]